MTEPKIIRAYDAIELSPGAERRLQERIDAALEKPMRETRVILKPRTKVWRYVFSAAAAALLILTGLWGVQRLHTANRQPTRPVPAARPEAAEEHTYLELSMILDALSQKEASFALSDYAARQSDGVVVLLTEIRQYLEERGLRADRIRGLLYGREDLDGASAEAYAALMREIYQKEPAEFLWAWHEAGEPVELMLEITGSTDPDETLAWLQQQWAVIYGAEARENSSFVDGEGQVYAIVTMEDGQNVVVFLDPRIEAESWLLVDRLSRDELLLRLEREARP